MANPNRKKAFKSNGSNYAGYREYSIDELLEVLEIILFNTYIQFNGCIFKQIPGMHPLLLPIYTYHGANIAT